MLVTSVNYTANSTIRPYSGICRARKSFPWEFAAWLRQQHPIQANTNEYKSSYEMRVSIWGLLIRLQAHTLSCFLVWKVIVTLVNEIIQIKVMKVPRRTWYNGCRMILFTQSKSSFQGNYARQTIWVHRYSRASCLRMVNWRISHLAFICTYSLLLENKVKCLKMSFCWIFLPMFM